MKVVFVSSAWFWWYLCSLISFTLSFISSTPVAVRTPHSNSESRTLFGNDSQKLGNAISETVYFKNFRETCPHTS